MSVRTETIGPVLVATIDRPEAHNALNASVLDGLLAALDTAESSAATRVVVVTASGNNAFCAGADLRELAGMDIAAARAVIDRGHVVMNRIARSTVPVITAVNGLALGGGFELVLASAFPVLSDNASLGLPETGLGLLPGYGGTQRLPAAVGPQVAAHLMLTGARIDAMRAHHLGLTPVPPVPPGRLLAVALETAGAIARTGPSATAALLEALRAGREMPLGPGLRVEAGLAALAIAGAESTEGISAFLERRAPGYAYEEATQ